MDWECTRMCCMVSRHRIARRRAKNAQRRPPATERAGHGASWASWGSGASWVRRAWRARRAWASGGGGLDTWGRGCRARRSARCETRGSHAGAAARRDRVRAAMAEPVQTPTLSPTLLCSLGGPEQLSRALSALRWKRNQQATVLVSSAGMTVSVAEAQAMRAHAFLSTAVFESFEYIGPVKGSTFGASPL